MARLLFRAVANSDGARFAAGRGRAVQDTGRRQNTMTPSAFQVPPARFGALQIICTAPPVTLIFLIRPPEKKAISRLSGDQKGEEAPSVPLNSSGVVDSNRLRKIALPASVDAVNASHRPSGEMVI